MGIELQVRGIAIASVETLVMLKLHKRCIIYNIYVRIFINYFNIMNITIDFSQTIRNYSFRKCIHSSVVSKPKQNRTTKNDFRLFLNKQLCFDCKSVGHSKRHKNSSGDNSGSCKCFRSTEPYLWDGGKRRSVGIRDFKIVILE